MSVWLELEGLDPREIMSREDGRKLFLLIDEPHTCVAFVFGARSNQFRMTRRRSGGVCRSSILPPYARRTEPLTISKQLPYPMTTT